MDCQCTCRRILTVVMCALPFKMYCSNVASAPVATCTNTLRPWLNTNSDINSASSCEQRKERKEGGREKEGREEGREEERRR